MTLLLASVLLAAIVAWWVAEPILERRAAMLADAIPGDLQDADARRRSTLASLRELEYEYLAGKLDDDDYRDLRRRLSREAVAAMDAVSALESRPAVPGRHECGHENEPGAKFCGGCGSPLM